jgi:hypothetical protein
MSMIFGIFVGLVLGWLGHTYWLKRQAPAGGTEKPQGGGGPGEEQK